MSESGNQQELPDVSTPRKRKRPSTRERGYGRRPTRGVSIAVNLAPMIDVTFLLLIFFLVSTTFERAEGIFTAPMPQQGEGPRVSLPLEPIVIRLAAPADDPSQVTMTIDALDQAPVDFGSLVSLIRSLHLKPGFDIDTPVVIVADDEVLWDHVVACWNAALRAGCRKVAFAEG